MDHRDNLENSVERVITLIAELQKRAAPKESGEPIIPFLTPCLRLSLAQVALILKQQQNMKKDPPGTHQHSFPIPETSQRSSLLKLARNAQRFSDENDFQSYLYKVWASVEKSLKSRNLKGWNLKKESYAIERLKEMGLLFFSYEENNINPSPRPKLHLISKKK